MAQVLVQAAGPFPPPVQLYSNTLCDLQYELYSVHSTICSALLFVIKYGRKMAGKLT